MRHWSVGTKTSPFVLQVFPAISALLDKSLGTLVLTLSIVSVEVLIAALVLGSRAP
jgi:Ca2+/H+ antiporter